MTLASSGASSRLPADDDLRVAVLRALPRSSVLVFDRSLTIALAEGGALVQHGYDPPSLVGRHVDEVVPAEAYAELRPRYLAALDGAESSFEYRTVDETRWYRVDVTPLRDAAGGVIGGFVLSEDITDRRHAEEQRDADRQWLQDILDSLATAISVKDADARFALINRAYEEGVGLRREDVVGKTVHDIYPEEFAAQYAADDERALRHGETIHEERPVPWSDGTVHTLAMSRSPLRRPDGTVYGLCGAGTDITDRKAMEEQLRKLTSQFETAFSKAPIGMALVGLDGRWLRVNQKLCELTGYTEEELSSMSFQDITHPDDLGDDLGFADRLLAGEIDSYTMEKRYFTKAGHLIWVLLAGSLVRDDEGRPLHFIAQVQDISERKRMVAQLELLAGRDPVTDLLNRRRFEEELRSQVARCRRYGEQACLLLLDVDHFKSVNDQYGHTLGDAALRAVGRILRERLRSTDVVARIGGDEFAVLLPNVAQAQAQALAEEVRLSIGSAPVAFDGQSVHVTVSIGVQPLDETTRHDQDAFIGADRAMYAAKAAGRDRVALAAAPTSRP